MKGDQIVPGGGGGLPCRLQQCLYRHDPKPCSMRGFEGVQLNYVDWLFHSIILVSVGIWSTVCPLMTANPG